MEGGASLLQERELLRSRLLKERRPERTSGQLTTYLSKSLSPPIPPLNQLDSKGGIYREGAARPRGLRGLEPPLSESGADSREKVIGWTLRSL